MRIKYPDASKGAETAVLVGATILFFSICNVFLSPHRPAVETVQEVRQTHGSLLKH